MYKLPGGPTSDAGAKLTTFMGASKATAGLPPWGLIRALYARLPWQLDRLLCHFRTENRACLCRGPIVAYLLRNRGRARSRVSSLARMLNRTEGLGRVSAAELPPGGSPDRRLIVWWLMWWSIYRAT